MTVQDERLPRVLACMQRRGLTLFPPEPDPPAPQGVDARRALKQARERAAKKGLTVEQMYDLLRASGGKCEVCGDTPPRHKDGRDGLYIDHRHDNGAIRGMLCPRCNVAAGVLDRDPEYLAKLAEYVKRGAG